MQTTSSTLIKYLPMGHLQMSIIVDFPKMFKHVETLKYNEQLVLLASFY